ncbi:MAG: pimeloyl-ACP methyl ester carboxylesterase [Flavobacteriales bacterium]
MSEILEVADQLDWPEFTILAHSRGAMAATLLAGSFPERVAGLVLIDAIYPRPLDESLAPLQLRQFVEARMDSSDKRSYFPDYERAIKARSRGLFPIELSLSRRLAERGVSQSEQGYYWHHDAGLMLPSEFKLSAAQIQSFIHGIRCPVLVFAADQGLLVNADYHLFEGTDCDIQIRQVQGPHHAHFCELDALVQTIAEETHVFLSTL